MKIAQLAPNVERVPPITYGGIELVVSSLTETLIERGHELTLFASGNSQTAARLVSVTDTPLRTTANVLTRQWQAFDIKSLLKLKEMQNEFDIVHNHMGYQALPYLDQLRCPVLSTNHNPIKPYNLPIYLDYRHLPYVAISNAFKQSNYPEQLNYLAVVYNGIDLTKFAINLSDKRSYLLFLGRIGKDKGTAEAIDIAQAVNLPLKIAGKVDETDNPYFEKLVQPRLGSDVEYIGEVDHKTKVDLLQKAIAVVYPIAFDEPFGLVMVESLACGTPVMSLNRGSVSEILVDNETGIVAHSKDELINRFHQIANIRPELCRARVQNLFSKDSMVDNYEKIYENLVNCSSQKYGKQYTSA